MTWYQLHTFVYNMEEEGRVTYGKVDMEYEDVVQILC
jgi:hypothetical protein